MAEYAKRTCSVCGIRKPQPEMYQKKISYESGKSKRSTSKGTWGGLFFGSLFGDGKSVQKKSSNAIFNSMFNTQQRTYTRTKTVWVCGDCK